ncbi:MAG TPA: Gmad2 immunoglobulin-like domain-containing protein [Candidatus Paceibacterota bacterium]|uniref:Bacterial spore germination immunoglobulin-like domain-containing protein n=1 Tax=Candidatus Ryanbacteria bacterium RIFCSPHIGHO2_01_FULL_45_22 TaxID=1802114 RepID=A0A1G2G2J9_9BACT|nr:MAG: hypothetical protein A2719_01535 [Candidatus Ryanbacteria bacterium RIFCSPHIGHO2_01_FULL_45_22]
MGLVIIVILAIALFLIPSPASAPGTDKTAQNESASIKVVPFSSDNVKVSAPLPGAEVDKNFEVIGEARGDWYFEGTFPVQVHDSANNRIGGGTAKSESDWMTTEFVPFSANISAENYSGPAILAFLKSNPSGLPENDDSVSIPIVIK